MAVYQKPHCHFTYYFIINAFVMQRIQIDISIVYNIKKLRKNVYVCVWNICAYQLDKQSKYKYIVYRYA